MILKWLLNLLYNSIQIITVQHYHKVWKQNYINILMICALRIKLFMMKICKLNKLLRMNIFKKMD